MAIGPYIHKLTSRIRLLRQKPLKPIRSVVPIFEVRYGLSLKHPTKYATLSAIASSIAPCSNKTFLYSEWLSYAIAIKYYLL
ncbi:hypothetical protein [Argonema galeatum]|uniref:hypothetical protein n=1 Tax=Argonema galeatum TaxID=2942762 RepID=UPI002011654A|nr:hypothetical protein [Argonema galeatum]MCL1466850.1 hypothetical protein [Argonema galeatum A003/A1]